MKKTLKMVTRKSPLALWAAHFVKNQLTHIFPELEVIIFGVTTEGDINLESSLMKIGGKGLFVKALEESLLSGEADIAVHAAKDMPVELPEGLEISAILEREDPRDALLIRQSDKFSSLKELPLNALIGTSSLRRQSQLLGNRDDLSFKLLRGNVDTRVQKLEKGEYDAIVLAAAGLNRINLSHKISEYFSKEIMLPAIGQGALCIESRIYDKSIQPFLTALHHLPTAYCILAERGMNKLLGGSCQLPVSGLATIEKGVLTLSGKVSSPDGKTHISAESSGDPRTYIDIGKRVAEQLLAKGAQAIIDACKL